MSYFTKLFAYLSLVVLTQVHHAPIRKQVELC